MQCRATVIRTVVFTVVCVLAALPDAMAERAATQGDFAVALVEKLGIDKDLPAGESIELLEQLGVEPDEGWKADEKLTVETVLEVYRRLMDAIDEGRLELTESEARRIVRELASEFGLSLPAKLPRPSTVGTVPSPATLGGGGGASVSE